MASLDSLSDGQRAVLQLLLRQNKSYEDLATLLKTDLDAVRARARGAVAALGPQAAGRIDDDRRDEISDYLLGQQSASRRAATREYLEGSAAGRAWARAVAGALSPIAGGELPDVPAEREEVAEAFDALDARAARQVEVKKSSQLGGRLIAAGIGVLLAIAIIIALSLGGEDADPGTAANSSTTPSPTSTTATTPTGDVFEVKAQGTLSPPNSGSPAKGEVAIVHFPDNDQFRLAFQATGLPPSSTRGSAYGVWLYTSPTESRFLGFPDTTVGPDGKLETVSDLSPDTPTYEKVLLTRETSEAPKQPGTIVLSGSMVIAAQPPSGSGATATTPGNTGGTAAPTTTTP